MCLSRVLVTVLVVRQQVKISDARNLLVLMNIRLLIVIWHLDDAKQLCVDVIHDLMTCSVRSLPHLPGLSGTYGCHLEGP